MLRKEKSEKDIRSSGLELLKIVAIVLIVIGHTTQTYGQIVDLSLPAANVSVFVLSGLFTIGTFGNNVFFICSAWFLLEQDYFKKEKWIRLFGDNWFITVLIMLCVLISGQEIEGRLILKSLFPNTLTLNWYISCYLIFYVIHGYLNKVIAQLDRRKLFWSCVVMSYMYIFVNWPTTGVLFYSNLMLWICLYFITAYLKKYSATISNPVVCLTFFVGAFALYSAFLIGYNYIGLRKGAEAVNMLRFGENSNPFYIIMAFSIFGLFKSMNYRNRVINLLASVTLYVYIIHENILMAKYYRLDFLRYMIEIFGGNDVLASVVLAALIIAVLSFCLGLLYKLILQKTMYRVYEYLFGRVIRIYEKVKG